MSESVVAERYARALFELGIESGQLAMLTDQLRTVANTYRDSAELKRVLSDPRVTDEQSQGLVEALTKRLALSPLVKNSLMVLLQRRRIAVLPDIVGRLVSLTDERTGVLRASVASATPLNDSQAQKLIEELERLTGKRIVLERRVDPSLIAGIVTRIGDHVIDASLKGRFEQLERRLGESPN
jgi:F-type H+-transporting ATPase subunit delta